MTTTRVSQHRSYEPFPYIIDSGVSDENPARWLDDCEDSLTALAASLIDGMRSVDRELERLQDWQYVAEALDCSQTVIGYLDARERRVRAHRAASTLRLIWTTDDEAALRQIQQDELEGSRRRSVIGCLNTRLQRLREDEDDSGTVHAEDQAEPNEETTESVSTSDWGDIPVSHAQEIAAAKETPALRQLLATAREDDAPTNIVEAINTVLTARQTDVGSEDSVEVSAP